RRGGRGRGEGEGEGNVEGENAGEADDAAVDADVEVAAVASEPIIDQAPAKPKRTRRKKTDTVEGAAEIEIEAAAEEPAELVAVEASAKPKRTRKKVAEAVVEEPPVVEVMAAEVPEKPKRSRKKAVAADATPEMAETTSETGEDDAGSPRKGWWQRTFANKD
ncbi:MAG: ribonuclease E/G, partial [Novosphingobium sp.]